MDVKLLLFALLVSMMVSSGLVSARNPKNDTDPEYIVGGTNTSISSYPYMGSLQRRPAPGEEFEHYCGATILHHYFIMTAAHCQPVIGDRVKFGVSDTASSGTLRYFEEVILHPRYHRVRGTPVNDIALIRLFGYLNYDNRIRPVKLPSTKASLPAGTNVTVIGWGTTTPGVPEVSPLQYAELQVVANEECAKRLRKVGTVTNSMICAGADGKDACQGDSGGPLIRKSAGRLDVQHGIVSWGIRRCGELEYPGVYTDVRKYRPWIARSILSHQQSYSRASGSSHTARPSVWLLGPWATFLVFLTCKSDHYYGF